jgi:phosphoribosylaminoimidazole-succinocarboxamide synthase
MTSRLPESVVRQGLSLRLAETDFSGLGEKLEGKVRDSYLQGDRRLIMTTDRVSAFDVVLGTVPFKGQILDALSRYWFEQTKHIADNHILETPDPVVTAVEECQVFGVEMIVRAYLTGSSSTSIWTHYESGARQYCGHTLPEGMRKHQPLAQPLITPTTKAEKGDHDAPLSAAEVVERGLATADEFAEMSEICLKLFSFGTAVAADRGLILVDTKYELGRRKDGTIVLVDEVHTPDSSRYWYTDGYRKAMEDGTEPRALDKEYLRRYLVDQGYRGQGTAPVLPDDVLIEACQRYAEIYALLTGEPFAPDLEPPAARIRTNLGI